MSEWVDVRGPSVEVAVTAALEELGLESPDAAEVEVLQEPTRGFLGMGGQDAVGRGGTKPAAAAQPSRGRGGAPSSAPSPSRQQPSKPAAPRSRAPRSDKPSRGGDAVNKREDDDP